MEEDLSMKICIFLRSAVAGLTFLPALAFAQAQPASGDSASATVLSSTASPKPEVPYSRPTEKRRLHNYFFDAFGPYPIVGAALAAGINQADSTPPEWKQGAAGYGKRLGSNFGISVVTTTTRYALATAFHEDTLYYRCECKGLFPRLSHAVTSTFTGRHGDDGHRAFSFPALISPYVGTMTAVYAWYPDRYGPKDAFRMGNYSLLAYVGGNVAIEFLYGGPHSLLSRLHLNKGRGAPAPSSNP
jgi:hypothetical protein